AAALSQMLLGPVAEDLKTRRLVIVAEGVLQYLPFATLPEPSSPRNQTHAPAGTDRDSSTVDHPPLVVEHEIVTLPSASVLAVLRQELGARKHADAKIAVLADPVFGADDPRVRVAGRKPQRQSTDASELKEVRRSAAESNLPDLVRLRFSRQEAAEIVRFASQSNVLEAVDFQANRATATSADVSHYSVLHLPTT